MATLVDLKDQFGELCSKKGSWIVDALKKGGNTYKSSSPNGGLWEKIWNGAPHQGSNHLSTLFSALPQQGTLDTRSECVARLETVNARRDIWIKAINEKFNSFENNAEKESHKKDFVTSLKKSMALRSEGVKCLSLYRMANPPDGVDSQKLKKDLHERHEKAVAAMHKTDQLEADLYVKLKSCFASLDLKDYDPKSGDDYAPFRTMLNGAVIYASLFPPGHPLLTWPVLGAGAVALTTKTDLVDVSSVAKTVASNAVYGGAIAAFTGKLCGMSPENQRHVFFWPALITSVSLAQDLKPKIIGLVQKAADTVLNSAKAYVREIRAVPITFVATPIAYSLLSGDPVIDGLKLSVVATTAHAAAVGLFALAESAEE